MFVATSEKAELFSCPLLWFTSLKFFDLSRSRYIQRLPASSYKSIVLEPIRVIKTRVIEKNYCTERCIKSRKTAKLKVKVGNTHRHNCFKEIKKHLYSERLIMISKEYATLAVMTCPTQVTNPGTVTSFSSNILKTENPSPCSIPSSVASKQTRALINHTQTNSLSFLRLQGHLEVC